MSEPLRVLQIEDSESDSELLVRLLEKAGFAVEWERVEDAEQMRAALRSGAWDVIIADFRLPRFDAPAALRILHEECQDIPFIIVSAGIGEALAVELMRSGAHDYVMKSNLARLPPAVEREVREARVRRERRQAEERLALALNATNLGTFDFYPQTGELIWSDAAKQHFGLPAHAKVSYEVFLKGLHPDDRERVQLLVQRALRPESGGQFATEYRTVGLEDGVERWLAVRGKVFFDAQSRAARFVGVTVDTSERRKLEDQFRQAQKLESIGRLAGAVAHDFNNLLTVISGYGQMVHEQLALHHPMREPVKQICGAADRATALTRQLLAFSRRQISQPKNIALNDLVRDIETMLRRLIGEKIDLVLNLDPQAGVFRADPGHIEQVIMNLAVNARDAMPDGGRLLIETSKQLVDETFSHRHLSIRPGTYAGLSVSDTGTGIPVEVRAQVFEPFFTTKGPGKGTGLGLSTVYGIVTQSEGAIWFYSEPGHGTTFHLLFPVTQEEPDPASTTTDGQARAKPGSGTILLAEDEASVREFIEQVLTGHGYSVLAASNGREALTLLRQRGGNIDLLLADVAMPELGGIELVETLGAESPSVPALLMSGYAEGLWDQGSLPAKCIQKPFTSSALLTRVRTLLESAES